jgi:hypothetical protein
VPHQPGRIRADALRHACSATRCKRELTVCLAVIDRQGCWETRRCVTGRPLENLVVWRAYEARRAAWEGIEANRPDGAPQTSATMVSLYCTAPRKHEGVMTVDCTRRELLSYGWRRLSDCRERGSFDRAGARSTAEHHVDPCGRHGLCAISCYGRRDLVCRVGPGGRLCRESPTWDPTRLVIPP